MPPDPMTVALLAKGPFARHPAPFTLLRVAGPDAGDFLQRLCSQDVLALAPGQLLPAAFLDAKGKVVATCRVFRDGDAFWLEVDEEARAGLLALLERYHFAERLAIAGDEDRSCRESIAAATEAAEQGVTCGADGAFTLRSQRRGVAFLRVHAACHEGGPEQPLPADLAECLRMAAGYVRVGVDTEPATLALEADLDDHCSPSKGCYTGQEIVARIRTYGHTNRGLCFLQLADGPALSAPAELREPEDGIPVGRVMRAVKVPGEARRFALGYLPPDFQAPGTRLRLADGADAEVIWG